jgi:hypothetical protein
LFLKVVGKVLYCNSFCFFQGARTSIRESDLEVKALLQLAGKTIHSEGMDDNRDEDKNM